MDKLFVSVLYDDAVLPTRKHDTDAGLDLYAYVPAHDYKRTIMIPPNETEVVHTGISVQIPRGYFGWITNKSRMNYIIGAGVVDEGYQGELLVKIINPNKYTEFIVHGTAIAQLLIIPCKIFDIVEVPFIELFTEKTSRSNTGGINTEVPDWSDEYNYAQDDFNFDAARERSMFGRKIGI